MRCRFFDKIDLSGPTIRAELGPCHIWTGCRDKKGYGKVGLNSGPGRNMAAHRLAFFFHHGRWPNRLACHRCDNPSCVNPSHIYDGDHSDNMRDMYARQRGRWSRLRG